MALRLIPLNQSALELLLKAVRTSHKTNFLRQWGYYSTFAPRDFLQQDSHGESGTLQTNFVKHIALTNCKTDQLTPKQIKYSDFYPIHNVHTFKNLLHKTPSNQFPFLLMMTSIYKSNGDARKLAEALDEVDFVLMKKKHEFDTKGILNVLYAIMFLIPNKITRFDFYSYSTKWLVENFERNRSKDTFVQICFYVGLRKKAQGNSEMMQIFLENYLKDYISELTETEFAIVSNAAFKAAVPLQNDEYRQKSLDIALNCDPKNSSFFATFIKNLRLNKCRSKELDEKLKMHLLKGNLNEFQFKGLTHVFAYFADGLCNDQEVCNMLTDLCLDKLRTTPDEEFVRNNDARAKDIATFLWCNAYLCNDSIENEDFKFLEEIILDKISNNEYKRCSDEYVDTILSLWMLNYKSKNLVAELFNIVKPFGTQNVNRVKLDSRFKLLRTCIQIENLDWIPSKFQSKNAFVENRKAPSYLTSNRTELHEIFKVIKAKASGMGIESVELVAPFEEVNVANILLNLEDGRKYFLEILDQSQLLRYDNKPLSIIQLKLRLFEEMGCSVIMVHTNGKQMEEVIKDIQQKLSLSSNNVKVRSIS